MSWIRHPKDVDWVLMEEVKGKDRVRVVAEGLFDQEWGLEEAFPETKVPERGIRGAQP